MHGKTACHQNLKNQKLNLKNLNKFAYEKLGIWSRLKISYELDDTLSIFITKSHIEKYGVIYRLLSRLRNCQIRLGGDGIRHLIPQE